MRRPVDLRLPAVAPARDDYGLAVVVKGPSQPLPTANWGEPRNGASCSRLASSAAFSICSVAGRNRVSFSASRALVNSPRDHLCRKEPKRTAAQPALCPCTASPVPAIHAVLPGNGHRGAWRSSRNYEAEPAAVRCRPSLDVKRGGPVLGRDRRPLYSRAELVQTASGRHTGCSRSAFDEVALRGHSGTLAQATVALPEGGF
jgi:hypothetical protein